MKKVIKKFGYIIFTIIFIESIFITIVYFSKVKIQDQYESNIFNSNKIQYTQLYNDYIMISELLYSEMISKYNIIDILKDVNSKTSEEKNKVRRELYSTLSGFYKRNKKLLKLKQFHFHLADNRTLLRFHRPNKYGDDLTKVRNTVNYVNTTNRSINGFEEGKTYNGFRFVFPLNTKDAQYIGAVETSLSIDAFLSKFQNLSTNNTLDFFVYKESVDNKVALKLKDAYYSISDFFPNYYREKVISNTNIIDFSKLNKSDISTINKKLAIGEDFIVSYYSDMYYTISFISLKNPVTNKTVGYIINQHRSNDLYLLNLLFWLSVLLSILFYTVILYLTIKNKIYNNKLFNQANIDYLTNIYNRRYFFAKATEIFENSVNQNLPMYLIMMDIDHFKEVNDKYGHNIGDIVLKKFTNVLLEKKCEKSILARIGGEEFVIFSNILPDNIEIRLNECKTFIEDMDIITSKGIVNITVSIGYTIAEAGDNSVDDLLQKSDKALYTSKDNGRNMISKYLRSNN